MSPSAHASLKFACLAALLACAGTVEAASPLATNAPPAFLSTVGRMSSPQSVARLVSSVRVQHAVAHAARHANAPPKEEALQLAHEALRQDHAPRARYLASHFLAQHDASHPDYVRALHMKGYAAWRAGDYATAVDALSDADARVGDDLLAPWRRAWLADASFRLGALDDANKWAAWSSESSAKLPSVHLARAAAARSHAQMADSPDPRTLLEFLDVYPEYPQQRDGRVELARSWYAVGNVRRSAETIQALLDEAPWSPQADALRVFAAEHSDLQAMLPVAAPAERLERARAWRLLRQWTTADKELVALIESATYDRAMIDLVGPTRLELARNAMEAGDYERADALFRQLNDEDWPNVIRWEALRDYGWNQSRLGHHTDGLQTLRRAAAERGGQAGTDFLFESLFDFGHFSEARSMLGSLSRAKQPDAFNRILLDYLSSDYERAVRGFDALAAKSTEHARLQALYWAARSELHLGKVVAARQRFARIVATRPHDYYGILAASRLADLDAKGQTSDDEPGTVNLRRLPGRVHWGGPEDTRPADFSVVAADAHSMTAYADELPPPADLSSVVEAWSDALPDLARAKALADMGADEDARQMFRRAVLEVQRTRAAKGTPTAGKPLPLAGKLWEHWTDNRKAKRGWWGISLSEDAYPMPSTAAERTARADRQRAIRAGGQELTDALIAIGRQLEDHHVVRRLVQRERGLSGNPPFDGERTDWLEAYPRPFPSTVVSLTRRYNLNPYLLWALIIVESDMNPDAISHADAYGLMQVIPKTGDRLAWELRDASFGIHDLLDPHESIRYGSWYMAELVHKFYNQESLALVGYNAGPHRVARWLDWRGAELDYDEFLETVPFHGARNYHKRILRYAATYQMLYEGRLSMYIGLDLRTDYDPKINF